jgi:hypothetical protein
VSISDPTKSDMEARRSWPRGMTWRLPTAVHVPWNSRHSYSAEACAHVSEEVQITPTKQATHHAATCCARSAPNMVFVLDCQTSQLSRVAVAVDDQRSRNDKRRSPPAQSSPTTVRKPHDGPRMLDRMGLLAAPAHSRWFLEVMVYSSPPLAGTLDLPKREPAS